MQAVGAASHWMNNPPSVEPLRLRRVPMLAAALCFSAGILLAHNWQPTRLLVLAASLLIGFTLVSIYFAPRVMIATSLAFWVVVGCWCAQIEPSVPAHPVLQSYADGLSRNVRGRITRVRLLPPQPNDTEVQTQRPWQIEPGGWELDTSASRESIDLNIAAVEDITPDVSTMRPLTGGVRILLTGDPPALHCGEEIELPLRMRTPDVYRDIGAFSYANQLLSEGIDLTATAKSTAIKPLFNTSPAFSCRLYAAQTWAADRLDHFLAARPNALLPRALRLNSEDTAMLNAMLFGNRTLLSGSLRDAFQRTGTFHLFVVSGLHIALLATGLYWLLRRLRLSEGPAVLIAIALTSSYALLTGFGVPAQRALLMASIYLLSLWLDRESSALNGLGFAACVVLAYDPHALFEPNFQMTFLVILAIAGIASPLLQRTVTPCVRALKLLNVLALDAFLHPRIAQFRVSVRMACNLSASLLGSRLRNLPVWFLRLALYVAEACIVSFAAELCLAIPMAIYFHRATLFALPLNLLNIPLLAVLLCAAVLMFCASLISAWLAMFPAALTALLLHIMRYTVLRLQAAPLADLRMPAPAIIAIAIAGALIITSCVLLREQHRFLALIGILAALLVPVVITWPAPPLLHPGTLEITALDVGQGDSLLAVSPTGSTMLIDAAGPTGRASTSSSSWDIGEQIVAPYLWSRRIRRLDVIVLTHAHSDHMGGMPAVLRDLRPRELWLSIDPGNSANFRALLAEATQLHIPVRHLHAGATLPWAGTQISVLSPELAYNNPGIPVNDDSLVLRIDYGRASALLEGDAEAASEDAMLSNHRLAPVTLLKIGHHGSKTSTNPEFLSAVTPRDAIISVGRHNTFGHPRAEILNRLEAAHVKTYRTDRHGAETFLLTPSGQITAFSADPPD